MKNQNLIPTNQQITTGMVKFNSMYEKVTSKNSSKTEYEIVAKYGRLILKHRNNEDVLSKVNSLENQANIAA